MQTLNCEEPNRFGLVTRNDKLKLSPVLAHFLDDIAHKFSCVTMSSRNKYTGGKSQDNLDSLARRLEVLLLTEPGELEAEDLNCVVNEFGSQFNLNTRADKMSHEAKMFFLQYSVMPWVQNRLNTGTRGTPFEPPSPMCRVTMLKEGPMAHPDSFNPDPNGIAMSNSISSRQMSSYSHLLRFPSMPQR